MTHDEREAAMAALLEALPYFRLYCGRTFVVKLGGSACAEPATLARIVDQVKVFHETGIRTVIVHGGGPQTTALAARLGVETRFVGGRRVTTPEALDAAVMALNGTVNTRILAACRATQLPALGLSCVAAGLARVAVRPPIEAPDGAGGTLTVDFGEVGDIVSVDGSVLAPLMAGGLVPVVSPISCTDQGRLLNINADTAAAAIACALDAEKLIFLTDAPGILENRRDPSSMISCTDLAGLQALEERGELGEGERLRAVAQGLFRIGMDLHHQAVRAHGPGGQSRRHHEVAPPGRVRGIHHDRQVRQPLENGNGREIQGVARRGLERADAALAQDDLMVTPIEYVFGGAQEFLDGRHHAALDEHRAVAAPHLGQQAEILHVAGADLQDVGMARHDFDIRRGEHIGHDRQPVLRACFGQQLQALEAQALEAVRRGARRTPSPAGRTGGSARAIPPRTDPQSRRNPSRRCARPAPRPRCPRVCSHGPPAGKLPGRAPPRTAARPCCPPGPDGNDTGKAFREWAGSRASAG